MLAQPIRSGRSFCGSGNPDAATSHQPCRPTEENTAEWIKTGVPNCFVTSLRPSPWADEMLTVAELSGYDDRGTPGQRIMWTILVKPEDLGRLDGDLRAFHDEVERPSAVTAWHFSKKLGGAVVAALPTHFRRCRWLTPERLLIDAAGP
jgi:hypothetical protein